MDHARGNTSTKTSLPISLHLKSADDIRGLRKFPYFKNQEPLLSFFRFCSFLHIFVRGVVLHHSLSQWTQTAACARPAGGRPLKPGKKVRHSRQACESNSEMRPIGDGSPRPGPNPIGSSWAAVTPVPVRHSLCIMPMISESRGGPPGPPRRPCRRPAVQCPRMRSI
jgi:hypothetical protein